MKYPELIEYDASKDAMVAYCDGVVVGECAWSNPSQIIADWILEVSQTKFPTQRKSKDSPK